MTFENMLEPRPLCNTQKSASHSFKKGFFSNIVNLVAI